MAKRYAVVEKTPAYNMVISIPDVGYMAARCVTGITISMPRVLTV